MQEDYEGKTSARLQSFRPESNAGLDLHANPGRYRITVEGVDEFGRIGRKVVTKEIQ